MTNDEKNSFALPTWRPGTVRKTVISAAESLTECEITAPPRLFYEALAERAEERVIQAISDAMSSQDDANTLANIHIARRLIQDIGEEIFLATEQADDAILAHLAAYLLLDGNDGYSDASFHLAWGAHGDPEWGTIWGIHQEVRDFTPAFIFKVCMRGDARFLGVECHAPTRRLPDETHARLRARTMIVSGIPVLAFSPAEVEADASACASEISAALAVLAQELLALHGIDHLRTRDFRPKCEI